MKLYYSPGACSLAPHIVASEAGIDLALEKVDLKEKKTADGRDYFAINPKGSVPAIELDSGDVLSEGPAIDQYLADLKPESGLAPANGTWARYQLQSMLNYISTELHKSYSPLFNPATPDATVVERKAYLQKRYALLEAILAKQPWLMGDHFTVADAYLFTVTRWAKAVHVDLSAFTALEAFQKRVAERPAVQKAMLAEGLITSGQVKA
ncbi:glutathione transferase GstA [Solilutibacter silvestris]|uniref:Glutathione S-transferase n=1 Tax=Solilutibacter silvestris TaxID=1645665 RepID=A0A2K1PZH6_9GAMM|nr:glutathione transferase GstA [Lysobacter silvestris]PNS08179.1 Glutathione S-transferase [Lysobacter silvestris]